MTTVPNQSVVRVQKEKADKENLFTITNLEALQCAMIDLNGEALKLWLYMSKNQNGYEFALSAVDAIKWGIGSKSSYTRARKELEEKGYLVETSKNHYDFYEKPKDEIIYIKKISE